MPYIYGQDLNFLAAMDAEAASCFLCGIHIFGMTNVSLLTHLVMQTETRSHTALECRIATAHTHKHTHMYVHLHPHTLSRVGTTRPRLLRSTSSVDCKLRPNAPICMLQKLPLIEYLARWRRGTDSLSSSPPSHLPPSTACLNTWQDNEAVTF